jgi:hypothetical protein
MGLATLVKGYEYKPPFKDRVLKPFTVWPSEASCVKPSGTVIGKCFRQMYYEYKKVPYTNSLSEHLTQTIIWGEAIEHYLINKFRSLGILEDKDLWKYKYEIEKDLVISARLDAIVQPKFMPKYGVEIKTYEGEPKYILERPKEHHLMQGFIYLVTFRPQLPYIIIYYRQRPGHRFAQIRDIEHRIDYVKLKGKTYPVINGKPYKDINFEGIVERWKKAKYYMINNTLPPKDYSGKARQCSWCLYRDKCRKED